MWAVDVLGQHITPKVLTQLLIQACIKTSVLDFAWTIWKLNNT